MVLGRLAGQDRLDDGLEAAGLLFAGLLVALEELRQHVAPEQLEALHDVLVTVLAGLAGEDDLVDAVLLVAAQVVADLVGCADGAAQGALAVGARRLGRERAGGLQRARVVAGLGPVAFVFGPHVGDARAVASEDVVVGEGVAEEVGALGPPGDGFGLGRVAHEGGDAGQVGVDCVADGHGLGGEGGVVVVHPLAGLLGVEERKRERADAALGGQVDRLPAGAGHPHGRVRLLERLGHDVAGRHDHALAGVAGEGRLGQAAEGDAGALVPHAPLGRGVEAEPAQLCFRRRLTGAELDPAPREQVEGGDAFGHAGGVVVAGRGLDDAVPQSQPRRPLGHGGQEHLGRRGVAVLLEEVVLDLPHTVHASLVRQLHLLEGVLEQLVLGVGAPRTGELVLVEQAELHRGSLLGNCVDGVVEKPEQSGKPARFACGQREAAASQE